MEVDLTLLDRSEPPFDESVIGGPAFAVHTDPNSMGLEGFHPMGTGVLAPLVGVNDLRLAVPLNGLLEQLGLGFLLQ